MTVDQTLTAPLKTGSIPGIQGAVSIDVRAGEPVFVLGANGVGKSALINSLMRTLGNQLVYLPGSRPVHFENESLSLTPATRRQSATAWHTWDRDLKTRWQPLGGNFRNERAIHDLQTAEIDFKTRLADQVKAEGKNSAAVAILQSNNSPLDRVNQLLKQGNLPIKIVLSEGELWAKQGEAKYSIAKLSDGERVALIFIAEVQSANDGSIFLVDEPELHLHRSIIIPLLKAFIRERPDCGFVVSTHELELPNDIEPATSILVRGCVWQDDTPTAWEIDVLPSSAEIPEDLRVDVLGARRKILFTEGTDASLDRPLYALLFPKVSVRPKNGCVEVRRAVTGLRSVDSLTMIEPYGLVDNDRMTPELIAELEAAAVFPLPIYAVESLYYGKDLREAVAAHQAATFGVSADDLLHDAETAALNALGANGVAEGLAARISERLMRDQVIAALPDRKALIAGTGMISINVPSPLAKEADAMKALITAKNLEAIITGYPVRESGALAAIAKGLRFQSRDDYEKAALTRLSADGTLADRVRSRLGALALKLT